VTAKNWFLLILFLLLVFIVRLRMTTQSRFLPGTRIKITAVLKEEPKIVGQIQRFSLSGIKIKTWRYPEYHYGDGLELVGIINSKMEIEKIEEIRLTEKNKSFMGLIFAFRRRIEEVYRRVLPEPQASLLAGIVLGSKSGMPQDFYQDLRQTGMLHVVVASGMNVTIVAATTVDLLLLFLSRRLAILFAFIMIWFYVLLAGADAPVLRAGVMGTLAFLAQGLGRLKDAWRGLGVAAVFLLLLNPRNLFDLGFQLSFVATAGILFLGPIISNFLKRVPGQVRADISQTLGAQIATLPLILITFGSYSPLSPLVNILVVPILPWLMRLGGLIGLVGLVLLPLGQILGWFILPFLTYFVEMVKLFTRG